MKDEQKDGFLKKEVKEWPKKPYTTPQLMIYGTVQEITEALGPGTKDLTLGSAIL